MCVNYNRFIVLLQVFFGGANVYAPIKSHWIIVNIPNTHWLLLTHDPVSFNNGAESVFKHESLLLRAASID